MIDQSSNLPIASSRRVRLQERAFQVGDIVGVNAFHINLELLKQRFIEGGYQVIETPHFWVCLRPAMSAMPTMLVHWFAPEAIDADLGHYFMEELKPHGLLANPLAYGNAFGAVVNSLSPEDPQRAWHLFGTNTLRRYHQSIDANVLAPRCDFPTEVFAALYRRVCELCTGTRLLDAGCSFGFLPLVIAARVPTLTQVVGVDIYTESFLVARALATERHLPQVKFQQANLLDEASISAMPSFDMVTALHVLEHFSEAEMYRVLAGLLKITAHRLVLAVPYEAGTPEAAYGHKQLFTREKLQAVGQWCIERWHGGQTYYEDCAGGLLYIDRSEPRESM